MYIYTRICTYIHVYVHIHMYMYMYLHVPTCTYDDTYITHTIIIILNEILIMILFFIAG